MRIENFTLPLAFSYPYKHTYIIILKCIITCWRTIAEVKTTPPLRIYIHDEEESANYFGRIN